VPLFTKQIVGQEGGGGRSILHRASLYVDDLILFISPSTRDL
jgi:hypothetical protein